MDKKEFKQKLSKAKPKSILETDQIIYKMLNETVDITAERVFIFAIEECAEFQQAITKYLRGVPVGDISNILEEIGDLEIIIRAIKILLTIPDETCEKAKAVKLNRIVERIENDSVLL